MTSAKENLTLNNKLSIVNTSFSNLFNEIGIIGNKGIDQLDPTLFHSSNNLERIYMEINKQLQSMKSTCQQYRQWENSKDLPRFQTTLKQYHATQQKFNTLSKSVSECSLIGKIYLDHLLSNKKQQELKENPQQSQQQQQQMVSSPNTLKVKQIINESKRKLSLLASKFHEMTQELDSKYGTYSDLEELNNAIKDSSESFKWDSVYGCNISSSTFLLDIFVYGNGEIKEVKLVHISMVTSEAIEEAEESHQDQNEELTSIIKSDIKEFMVILKKICTLDLLFRKFNNQFDLQKSFLTFQNDFKQLSLQIQKHYQQQQQIETQEYDNIYNHSFGEIKIGSCGIKINYFNQNSNHFDIYIEMEESFKLNKISLLPMEIENLQFKNTSSDDNLIEAPIQYLMKLENNLIITQNSLYKIQNSNNKDSEEEQQQQQFNYNNRFSIQSQILKQSNNNNENETIKETNIEIMGFKQKYYYTGEYHLGLQVSKFPISHPSEILPIIQILRQEITWNLLFKSCFQSFKYNPSNSSSSVEDNETETVFEITSEPPKSISIIYLNSKENIFHSIEIQVELGGEIKVDFFENNNENNEKSLYLSKLLKKSLSIPLSFYFLSSCK